MTLPHRQEARPAGGGRVDRIRRAWRRLYPARTNSQAWADFNAAEAAEENVWAHKGGNR